MAIRFLQHNEIDKERWDATVNNCVARLHYAASWYLDIVCPGWVALADDDYSRVFALPVRRKYGLDYVFFPPFLNQLGVISKRSEPSAVNEFLSLIPKQYRLVDLPLNHLDKPADAMFNVEWKKAQFIDLSAGLEKIRKGYSENHRRNVKKALTAGLTLDTSISPEAIVHHFRMNTGSKIGSYTNADYRTLKELFDRHLEAKKGFGLGVRSRSGHYEAVAFFSDSHERLIFIKGGAALDARTNGAMHFLFDNVIERFAGTKKLFDFGGSSIDSVARFNLGFGADEYRYPVVKRNKLPALARWLSTKK